MYIGVSEVGLRNIGESSSFSPPWVTQYTSFLKPESSSSILSSDGSTPASLAAFNLDTSLFSLSNKFSGTSRGNLCS